MSDLLGGKFLVYSGFVLWWGLSFLWSLFWLKYFGFLNFFSEMKKKKENIKFLNVCVCNVSLML